MSEPTHPLTRPLPHDVAAGESAFIRFYQQYAVFSWPWAWRRTVLFGAIGALAGAMFGASHGLYVKSWAEGISVSLACAAANLVLVGAGPVVASFFRHRALPRAAQSALIVASIVLGVVLAAIADNLASAFHDSQMAAHGFHGGQPAMVPVADFHAWMRHALDFSRDLLLLLAAGGGFALPAYFTEKKRWAEHRRRLELEKMGAQKAEADARLTLLQAQVEPHFLFNTLASVRSLIASDPARAGRTIDALATHLRATLPKLRASAGTPLSTLGEQFAICASYLDLMQVRLGDRLRYELRLPETLRDAPFPPLLLISLVENAIKHGAEPKPAPTLVVLAARRTQGRLEVTVDDDGAGLAMGVGEGTGLANVRAQLRTRFGDAAAFELEQAGAGVRARLYVPSPGGDA